MGKNRGNILKRTAAFILAAAALLSAAGCHKEREADTTSETPQPLNVAVADNNEIDETIPAAARLVGKSIYFVKNEAREDAGGAIVTTLYVVCGDEKKALASVGAEGFITYFLDGAGRAYLVYKTDPAKAAVNLRAVSTADGSVDYDENLTDMLGGYKEADGLHYLAAGAREDGGFVYMACADGRLYVYDENNKTVDYKKLAWDENVFYQGGCGLVDTGKTGAFEYAVNGSRITLRSVADQTETYEFELDSGGGTAQRPEQTFLRGTELYGGCDGGVFICDAQGLWKYVLSEKEPERLLNWDDEYVNLGGRQIGSVGYEEGEGFFVLSRGTSASRRDVMLSAIEYKDMLSVEEKQTVTVGIYRPSSYSASGSAGGGGVDYFKELQGWFNSRSEKYVIEYVEYSRYTDMQMALAAGNAPDLMIGNSDLYGGILDLADKGALEDLSPYFEQSSALGADDLLPCIKNAGTIDGRLVAVPDSFYISGLWVKKKEAGADGGSVPFGLDEFLDLIEEHPQTAIRNWGDYEKKNMWQLWLMIYYFEQAWDKFVDFDSGRCSFDSNEFTELLERLAALELIVPERLASAIEAAGSVEERNRLADEAFLSEELLFASGTNLFSCGGARNWLEKYGEYAQFLGYPHDAGTYYRLNLNYVFAINSAAKNKEGAWEVIESVLSENYHGTYEGFPVTAGYFEEEMNGEDKETQDFLRYVMENSYTTARLQGILPIIYEEVQPFFSGQKSAKETADVIQGKAQIYLDERQ